MSGEYPGKKLLLQVENAAIADTWATVGGLESKGITKNSEGIESTNHGSEEWRELLNNAGVKSIDISAEGFSSNHATLKQIDEDFETQTLRNFRVIDMNGDGFQCEFKIVTFETNGEHSGAQKWSLSLQSSGRPTKLAGIVP